MSLVRPILNHYLRLTEKRHLRKVSAPDTLRSSFEAKARLFFHGPRAMRSEWQELAHAPALRIEPRHRRPDLTLLYFHGGGYVFGSPRTHGAMLATLAQKAGAQAILPVYPLSPEHPFPAALDHARAAYDLCWATQAPLAIGGDSAGGGLALALLATLLEENAPLPDGVFAFSPLTDLTFSGDSIFKNAGSDVVLPSERTDEMARMYLDGHDPSDPRVSPVFAKFQGAPPVWITAGNTEILVDDSRRIVANLQDAQVDVTYDEQDDVPHVWPLFHNTLPEARKTLNSLARWLQIHARASDETR